VVPTIYTVSRPSSPISPFSSSATLFTNQYAVTEQSYQIGERAIPGIFVKYDIEPILLMVEENRESFLKFCVKVVNILSGVLVAGHWGFTISGWAVEVFGRRAKRKSEGVLNGKAYHDRDD
jgi:endoplasmic reticulum-Golgi intermediate compartment protein 2